MRMLIATENQGKVKEIQALLQELDLELVTPKSIGLSLDVVEDGMTYEDNAGKKAAAYARASGLIALADDSGLEVDALNGAPGLYSARYSSLPGATDADRRALLLENLRGKPRPWSAHFHAVIAICEPDGVLRFTAGDCFGEIIPDERGTNGFGYDPIFLIPAVGRTTAQLSTDEKNRLSHRALAIRNAIPVLKGLLEKAA